ncbi:hypothetical protein A2U01_0050384, partial [Trifolium medium]|nr:hypothetical protein [Trifolium medium]
MYSSVCKQQGNTDHGIATFITAGFIGQIKGWWDFYLTEEQRNEILTHKKITEASSSNPVTAMAVEEQDAVYTLCLTILR